MVREAQAAAALSAASVIFEGVPEVLELKREVLARAPRLRARCDHRLDHVDHPGRRPSGAVEHPERFLNAHWLNPAYLIPLVELSPGAGTDPAVTARLKALLEGIGKVPVVCAPRPATSCRASRRSP